MSVQQEQHPQPSSSSSTSFMHRPPPRVPGPNTGKKYIPWKTHQIELLSQYLKEHVTFATSPSIDSCRIIKMEVFPDDEEVTPRRLFGKICNMRAAYRKLENSGLAAGVRGRRKSTNPAVYGGFVMSTRLNNNNASEYNGESRSPSVTSTSIPGPLVMNNTPPISTSFTSAGESSANQSIYQSAEPRRKARRRRHYQMDSIYSEFDPNKNSALSLNSANITNANSKKISFNSLNRPINNNNDSHQKASSVVDLESSGDEDDDDHDDDDNENDEDEEAVMDMLEKEMNGENDISQFFQSNAQSTPNASLTDKNSNGSGNSKTNSSHRSINSSDIVALLHHTLQTHLSHYPVISPSPSLNSSNTTSPSGARAPPLSSAGNYGSSHNMLLTYLQSKLDQDAHINKLLIESLERIERVKAMAQIRSAKALEKCAGKLVTLMENEQLFQNHNPSNNSTPTPPSSSSLNPKTQTEGNNTHRRESDSGPIEECASANSSTSSTATSNTTNTTATSSNSLDKRTSKEDDNESCNNLEEIEYKREKS